MFPIFIDWLQNAPTDYDTCVGWLAVFGLFGVWVAVWLGWWLGAWVVAWVRGWLGGLAGYMLQQDGCLFTAVLGAACSTSTFYY